MKKAIPSVKLRKLRKRTYLRKTKPQVPTMDSYNRLSINEKINARYNMRGFLQIGGKSFVRNANAKNYLLAPCGFYINWNYFSGINN